MLLGLSVITFLLARVVPSNAAAVFIGPKARPDDIARVTRELGLDQPLPVQYLTYMLQMLRGDWGTSIGTKRPVLEVLSRLPATLELSLFAMLIAIPVGLLLGILSAADRQPAGRRGPRPDPRRRVAAGLLPGPHPPGHLLPEPRRAAPADGSTRTCDSRHPSRPSPAS